MFALTSSFSLSTEVTLGRVSDDDISNIEIISNPNNKEYRWRLEMVESKNTDSSTQYFVNKENTLVLQEQKITNLYKKKVENQATQGFINKELKGEFDSTFILSKPDSKNVIVGVISKEYKLSLFSASNSLEYRILFHGKEYMLNKKAGTFLAMKEIEEIKKDHLKLYFNGQGKKS